jgi:hypothetical protein
MESKFGFRTKTFRLKCPMTTHYLQEVQSFKKRGYLSKLKVIKSSSYLVIRRVLIQALTSVNMNTIEAIC